MGAIPVPQRCSRSPEAPEEFSKAFPKPGVLLPVTLVHWLQSFPCEQAVACTCPCQLGACLGSCRTCPPQAVLLGCLALAKSLFHPLPSWRLQSGPHIVFQTWGAHLPHRDKPCCLLCCAVYSRSVFVYSITTF